MKVKVELELDLNVDRYAAENPFGDSAIELVAALRHALAQMKHPENYLNATEWRGLVDVKSVEVTARF